MSLNQFTLDLLVLNQIQSKILSLPLLLLALEYRLCCSALIVTAVCSCDSPPQRDVHHRHARQNPQQCPPVADGEGDPGQHHVTDAVMQERSQRSEENSQGFT